ncbi:helix-turn-helix transcriptional regulator [Rhizobium hidalgonense]|uniref:helix-turn-helix transcriptional regulator n=1 Tax=Rhizobium hidalgonense TaxID=1538159 RepID=UPI002872231F|nr:helix-turn-helix domain-containing protein [Rhizobium hidalgonense]MDR9812128.1 helix-turn-helix domain-containing protein [Rhizobium hidalgonense]
MNSYAIPTKDDLQKALSKLLTNAPAPLLVETREAAQILGLSASTLEKWRFHRTPGTPPVVRIGRACRYRLADLREWVDQQGGAETGRSTRNTAS